MARHTVCRVGELPPGERKIVEVGGRSIGVFNVGGEFYALRNSCPHQAAPLCRGSVKGMAKPGEPGEYVWEREGEILRCPWHGWEFDIKTGGSIYNPHKTRVRSYEVTVEEEEEESVETYPVTVEGGIIVLHT
jgi:nitrite reductase/ring-hydroxylating ferredoxin subunit